MLSKSLSTSEKRARLHAVTPLAEFAQALYPLLISHADDFGRESGDLFTVKHAIDPSSPRSAAEFAEALQALVLVGLIEWYQATDADGRARKVLQIIDFEPHQHGLHKRTTSKFPGSSGNFQIVPPQLNLTELNRTEQNRTEQNGTSTTRLAPRVSPDPHPKTARENVKVITRLIIAEVLPLGLTDDDLAEVTKARCAALRIPYDSGTVATALRAALGLRKRQRAHR